MKTLLRYFWIVAAFFWMAMYWGERWTQPAPAPWTQCPTPWRDLIDANGQLIGKVCYKPDGSRRILRYR